MPHKQNVRRISSGSEFESRLGYSRAVIDGDYVFVAGTTGYDYATMTIDEDVRVQTEQCFNNIDKVLTEAGSGLDCVVRVTYIFPNRADAEVCAPLMRKYLGAAAPAATMLVAGLMDEKMKIEIEVTARVDDGAAAK